MKGTLTISVAGPVSRGREAWRSWEALVVDIARGLGLAPTHAGVTTSVLGGKYRRYRPIGVKDYRKIVAYSLASVGQSGRAGVVHVVRDALLTAHRIVRWGGGVSISVALSRIENAEAFVGEVLPRLRAALLEVRGVLVFVLPPSELPANYALGLNDVRECESARVLVFRRGGFVPKIPRQVGPNRRRESGSTARGRSASG